MFLFSLVFLWSFFSSSPRGGRAGRHSVESHKQQSYLRGVNTNPFWLHLVLGLPTPFILFCPISKLSCICSASTLTGMQEASGSTIKVASSFVLTTTLLFYSLGVVAGGQKKNITYFCGAFWFGIEYSSHSIIVFLIFHLILSSGGRTKTLESVSSVRVRRT